MSNELEEMLRTIVNEKETKILPENIKKGIKIFDVEGELENITTDAPVKLFETVEEMNASLENEDGDLAIVKHGSILAPIKLDTGYNSITFPKTVILPEAYSSSTSSWGYGMNETSDIVPGYYDGKFSFACNEWATSNPTTYSYSSSDGKTYVLEGAEADVTITYDTPMVFTTENQSSWIEEFTYFMLSGAPEFCGVYEYITATGWNLLASSDSGINPTALLTVPHDKIDIVKYGLGDTGITYRLECNKITTPIYLNEDSVIEMTYGEWQLAEYLGITPDMIKAGETILGVTGTYTGDDSPVYEDVPGDDVIEDDEW